MQRLLCFSSLLILIFFSSCKPTKEDYRHDFVKGCVNRYAKDSTVANTEGRKMVEAYCNCMGDQLNAKMDADLWRSFNKSGDTSLSEYKPFIEPCIEDFKKKIEALKP